MPSPPAARIVMEYLVDQGLVTTNVAGPWKVYAHREADKPDRCVTVYETTPRILGRGAEAHSPVLERPGVQVRVRGPDYEEARAKGLDIQDALAELRNTTVSVPADAVYTVGCFTRTASLQYIGRQEKSTRELFTVNGLLTVL